MLVMRWLLLLRFFLGKLRDRHVYKCGSHYMGFPFGIIRLGLKLTSRGVNPCGTILTTRGQHETKWSARSRNMRLVPIEPLQPRIGHVALGPVSYTHLTLPTTPYV